MKYKIISLLFAIALFSACKKDLLEKIPKTTLNPENFWQNEKDLLVAVNGLYPILPGISWIDRDMWSDLAISGEPVNNNRIEGNFQANDITTHGEPSPTWLWFEYYKGITATNYFLENSAKTKDKIDPAFYARVRAEARFIRSFVYMQLVMDFGDVPLVTNVLTMNEGFEVTRTPANDVWDFIESELSAISNDLPIKYSGSDIGRITKGAVLALKAKSMLYAKRYEEAYNAAKSLIDMNIYSLHPDYSNLFEYDAQNNSEVILDIQYAQDLRPYGLFASYAPIGMSKGWTCLFSVTSALVDKFEMQATGLSIENPVSGWNPMDPYKNRDPRLAATILIPYFSESTDAFKLWDSGKKLRPQPGSGTPDEIGVALYANKTGFFLKKYINKEDIGLPGNCGTNFILIRYADVLLIAAEALIELNQNLPEAKEYIDEVRVRAGMPEVNEAIANNQNDLRQTLRHERLVELALEGWRSYDIIRWRIAEELIQGKAKGMSYLAKDEKTIITIETNIIRNFTSKDYLLPIPQNERDLNPNLTQNLGYQQ